MCVLHFGVTAGKGVQNPPNNHLEEQRPKGKELSLEVGDRHWLGKGQTCAPSDDELAMGLGSSSGPLAHRTLGWEHPARTPELCTCMSPSAAEEEEDGAQ